LYVSENNFPLGKAKASESSHQDVFSPVPAEQAKLDETTRQTDVASLQFGVQQQLRSIDQPLSLEENAAVKSSDSLAESSTANAFLEGFLPVKFDGIHIHFLTAHYCDKHLPCNNNLFLRLYLFFYGNRCRAILSTFMFVFPFFSVLQ